MDFFRRCFVLVSFCLVALLDCVSLLVNLVIDSLKVCLSDGIRILSRHFFSAEFTIKYYVSLNTIANLLYTNTKPPNNSTNKPTPPTNKQKTQNHKKKLCGATNGRHKKQAEKIRQRKRSRTRPTWKSGGYAVIGI